MTLNPHESINDGRKRKRLEEYDRSALVERMIEMMGRGQLSVTAAAGLSQSCVEDGMLHEAVAAFASLGNHGACPSNYERDLHRWLRTLFGFELRTYVVSMNLEAAIRNSKLFGFCF